MSIISRIRATSLACFVLLVIASPAFFPAAAGVSLQPPGYTSHTPIVIQADSGFVATNGVTAGTGTGSDPFIIQYWDINASGGNGITIVDTRAYFVIENLMINSGVRGIFLQNVTHGAANSVSISNNQNPVIIDHSSNVVINATTISNSLLSVIPPAVRITNSTNVAISASTISAPYTNVGITVSYSNSVRIIGNHISVSKFDTGIYVQYSSMVMISQNSFSGPSRSVHFSMSGNSTISTNNLTGILAEYSVTVSIVGNTISGGVDISSSTYSTISNNVFLGTGLILGSGLAEPTTQNILPNNMVNGKPLYAYKNCLGISVDGVPVGQLIMVGCQGVRIANLRITNTTDAIYLAQVQGALVLNNNVLNNSLDGMRIDSSSYLTVVGNTAKLNGFGLRFGETANPGAKSVGSSFISIEGNSFDQNQCGLCGLDTVSSANIYHNNFINNTGQVNGFGTLILDNGYPSGGNYWSDYTGIDNCSGSSQNICPNPDGIGDTPYLGDNGLKDRYPLMKPYSPPPDSKAPTWPTGSTITISSIDSTSATLSWSPATDDIEVIAYRIYSGTTIVGYVPGQYHSFTVTGLNPGTSYTFKLEGGDASDNWTQNSLSTTATTPNPILVEVILLLIGSAGASVALAVWWNRRRQRFKLVPPTVAPAN